MTKQKTTMDTNSNISLFESIIPIVLLVALLYINVNVYGESALDGSNQFILIIGAAIAVLIAVSYTHLTLPTIE